MEGVNTTVAASNSSDAIVNGTNTSTTISNNTKWYDDVTEQGSGFFARLSNGDLESSDKIWLVVLVVVAIGAIVALRRICFCLRPELKRRWEQQKQYSGGSGGGGGTSDDDYFRQQQQQEQEQQYQFEQQQMYEQQLQHQQQIEQQNQWYQDNCR
jgi:hypothetical protein